MPTATSCFACIGALSLCLGAAEVCTVKSFATVSPALRNRSYCLASAAWRRWVSELMGRPVAAEPCLWRLQACSAEIAYSSCNFALPTTALWYFCYIAISVMVFGLCPFAMFYYEGDSDM